jgi:predicted Zn-dependent protease
MKYFFQTLKAKYDGGMGPWEFGIGEFFSTHPDTQKRIDEVVRIAKKTPNASPDDGATEMYTTDFEAIKSKI